MERIVISEEEFEKLVHSNVEKKKVNNKILVNLEQPCSVDVCEKKPIYRYANFNWVILKGVYYYCEECFDEQVFNDLWCLLQDKYKVIES